MIPVSTGPLSDPLMREFASRLIEALGVSGHEVRDWLGHANISTTSRYLSTTAVHLQNTLRKFEQVRQVCTQVAQDLPQT